MLDKTKQDWRSQADGLEIESRAFTNGRYQDAMSGETRETMSPGDGRKLADVANCGIEDADQAVKDARATFEAAFGHSWRRPREKWCWFAGRN